MTLVEAAPVPLVRALETTPETHGPLGIGYAELTVGARPVSERHGVDLIVDSVGGDVFDACLRAIAWCGRLVTVGFASGRIPEVKAGLILVKNISLIGLHVSDYRDRAADKTRAAQAELFRLYEAGRLKPHVMAVHPFEAYREALAAVRDRHALGKVVLALKQ